MFCVLFVGFWLPGGREGPRKCETRGSGRGGPQKAGERLTR